MNSNLLCLCTLIFLFYSCGSMESDEDSLELPGYQGVFFEDEVISVTRQEEMPVDLKSKTWKRSNKIANTTSLFIGDNEELPLKGSQIAVSIDGYRARVLIDCFFYNDKEISLEGTFKMKLPQGATPYYFAFGEST